jgi:hypothetical protein
MIKKLGRVFGGTLLACGLMEYGIGAFAAWDANPGHWEVVSRLLLAVAWPMASLMVTACIMEATHA